MVLDDVINLMFSDPFFTENQTHQPVLKEDRNLCSGTFPPSNLYIENDSKTCVIEVALAGVKKENISISFEGSKLILKVKNDTKTNEKVWYQYRSLKKVENATTYWNIDRRSFDIAKIDIKIEDGLLVMRIPPTENCKPLNIQLFGEAEKIEEEVISEESEQEEPKKKLRK